MKIIKRLNQELDKEHPSTQNLQFYKHENNQIRENNISIICQDWNQEVFAGGGSSSEALREVVSRQVKFIHDEIFNPIAVYVEASKQVVHIKWIPPPHNAFKLNTDGSHKQEASFSLWWVNHESLRTIHCRVPL